MTAQDQTTPPEVADLGEFTAAWQTWHAAQEARLADPHGFLAITSLNWLTDEPQRFPDAPGAWHAGASGVTHINGTPSHWRRALMSSFADRMAPRYVRLRPRATLAAILDEHADQALPDKLNNLISKMTVETVNLRPDMLVNVTPELAPR